MKFVTYVASWIVDLQFLYFAPSALFGGQAWRFLNPVIATTFFWDNFLLFTYSAVFAYQIELHNGTLYTALRFNILTFLILTLGGLFYAIFSDTPIQNTLLYLLAYEIYSKMMETPNADFYMIFCELKNK